mmetsp:Transcript_20744/g.57581  ORF Transcript_20744/g.57581 Transcript_20744/m.57581 type:complete len:1221 (+) Transcript_20744:86-3748(+)
MQMSAAPHRRKPARKRVAVGLPSGGRCLVPLCRDSASVTENPKRVTPLLCRQHLGANSFRLNGVLVRYCIACKRLHSVEDFDADKNVCRKKHRRLKQGLHALRRQRIKAEAEAARWFAAGAVSRIQAYLGLSPDGSDPGRRVWGDGIVAILRAETRNVKVAIAITYAATAWLLGWQELGTWIAVLWTFFNLHVLIPYVHGHFYAANLRRCRQEAEQCGLALTCAFRLLDPHEDLKYDASKAERHTAARSLAVFIYNAWCCLHPAWMAYKTWGTSPTTAVSLVMMSAAVFFPLDQYAQETRQYDFQGWLHSTLIFTSVCAYPWPSIYWWASGICGSMPKFICGMGQLSSFLTVALDLLQTVGRAAVCDIPWPMAAGLALFHYTYHRPIALMFFASVEVACPDTSGFPRWMHFHNASLSLSILVGELAYIICREKEKLLRFVAHRRRKAEFEALASGQGDPTEPPLFLAAVKMRSVSPAHLRPDLRERLAAAMQVEPQAITAVIRPGCVMLGLMVRPGSWGHMREAWSSMRSHGALGETLLLPESPVDISLTHRGCTYQVQEGWLEHSMPESPVPTTGRPAPLVATPEHAITVFCVAGLGGSGFKVLLRTAQSYYELEVVSEERRRPGAPTTVGVRLPTGVSPGLCWLEVMVDTDDSSLVLSEPFPLLFSPLLEIAEEVNRLLPADYLEDPLRLGVFLQDASDSLHEGRAASPLLLLKVISLGLPECFHRMATRDNLRAADRVGQGLLGTAARSSSVEMLQAVIWTLRQHRLPVDPCQKAPDADGYTALHWAAHMGNYSCIYLLLAETPSPIESWGCLTSRRDRKTPAAIVEEMGDGFFLDNDVLAELRAAHEGDGIRDEDEDTLSVDSWGGHFLSLVPLLSVGKNSRHSGRQGLLAEQADLGPPREDPYAVWGSSWVGILEGRNATLRASFLACYAAAWVQLGWQEPLTWFMLLLAALVLHVILPQVHKVYTTGLLEARAVAAPHGVRVSKFFSLIDQPHLQRIYERHVCSHALPGLSASIAMMVPPMLGLTSSAGQLLAAVVSPCLWFVPAIVCCASAIVRVWAIRSARYRLWQWLDTATEYFIRAAWLSPAMYALVSGHSPLPGYPSKSLLRISEHSELLLWAACAVGQATWGALHALLKKQPVAGRLALHSEVCFGVFVTMVIDPVFSFCLAGRGLRLSLALSLLQATVKLLLFEHHLRADVHNLCTFLRSQVPDKHS